MPHSSHSESPRHDANVIKLISARESVRTRPEMYIRETDDHQKMLHQLLWQTVAGLLWHSRFLTHIRHQIEMMVQLESDGSASVASTVPAVSATVLKQSIPLLEHALSHIAGEHPLDLFVVNAFSDHLRVTVREPDNHWHVLLFEQGVLQRDEVGTNQPQEDYDIQLRFWPDFPLLQFGSFDSQSTLQLMRSFADSDLAITLPVRDARTFPS